MLISTTIDDALITIGVKSPIDEATPQDHEFGLKTLNRIIDSYNTQNLIVTYLQDIMYEAPLVHSECEEPPPTDTTRRWKNVIEIDYCKDINEQAPIDIQSLFWRQAGTDYPSKEMTFNTWSDIGWKTAEGIPNRHYIQKTDTNGVILRFDMTPMEGLELHLMAKKPYTGKNSEGNNYTPQDDISWSFGFEKMLMLRLAMELCPSYEIQPSEVLFLLAQEAEDNLKAFNYQPMIQGADIGLTGGRMKSSSRNNRGRY